MRYPLRMEVNAHDMPPMFCVNIEQFVRPEKFHCDDRCDLLCVVCEETTQHTIRSTDAPTIAGTIGEQNGECSPTVQMITNEIKGLAAQLADNASV